MTPNRPNEDRSEAQTHHQSASDSEQRRLYRADEKAEEKAPVFNDWAAI